MNQKFLPLGGMNLSTSLSLVPPSDYTAAFNCHISNDSEGKAGAITNLVGNVPTSIPYFEDPDSNPYRSAHELNIPNTFETILSVEGQDFNNQEFHKILFADNVKRRVLGSYEEPDKRRLYYFIGWDHFDYSTTDGLNAYQHLNNGMLALICFEQYETVDDYYILQENGDIIITEDGDFLINENAEDGDLLGQNYLVGWWAMQGRDFEWDDNFCITGIGKIGNEMYWAMGDVYEPMTIDVERGILTYQPSYVSEYKSNNEAYLKSEDSGEFHNDPQQEMLFLKKDYFKIIKRGGRRPLITQESYDDSISSIIGRNVIQFAYRYIYKNGYRSVLSPYSVKTFSHIPGEEDQYNKITITFPETEELPLDIDKVEFCVREGFFDSTDSNWNVFKIIDREDIADSNISTIGVSSFDYVGDRTGEVLDDVSNSKPYDFVPYKSDALEVAKNRVFLGNVIPAGSYDLNLSQIYLDFETLDPVPESVSAFASYIYYEVGYGYEDQGGTYPGDVNGYIFIILNSEDTEDINGAYLYHIASDNDPVVADFNAGNLPSNVNIDPSSVVVSWAGDHSLDNGTIAGKLDSYYGEGTGNTGGTTQEIIQSGVNLNPSLLAGNDITTPNNQSITLDNYTSNSENYIQYKSGTSYQFGIVLYDKDGRTPGAITKDEWIIDIPFRTASEVNGIPGVKATFVAAPSWAYTFSIVRTKNLTINDFSQYRGTVVNSTPSVQYARTNKVDGVDSYELLGSGATAPGNAEFLAIGLTGLRNNGGGWSIGDTDSAILVKHDDSQKIEVKIISQHVDDAGNIWLIASLQDFEVDNVAGNQPLIELRRNIKQSEGFNLFYETATIGRTNNAGQMFTIQGDVRTKLFGAGLLMEVKNLDMSRDTWVDRPIGRAFPSVPEQVQQRIGDRIYFSGVARPDATRTFINSFNGLDYKETSDNGGDIQVLKMTSRTDIYGATMLAIAETNTTSLYLGETMVRDTSGNISTTASSDVIGGMSEIRGMYGTQHPASVAAYQGTVCWFDIAKGAVVRYSSQGIDVISDRGMSNYFRTMTDFVRPFNLAASINKRYNQYYIHISQNTSRPVRTLQGYVDGKTEKIPENPFEIADGFVMVYDLETDRWSSVLTYDPDYLDNIGTISASFELGRLWIHKSASRNKFFGNSYPSKIAVVLNSSPGSVKIPDSISVESNNVPSHVYIQNLRPYIQQTDISSDEFRDKEGIFYAPVLRDRLTNGSTEYQENLLKGEKIRGQYIQIALIMDYPDDDFEVNAINVKYTMSSGHVLSK